MLKGNSGKIKSQEWSADKATMPKSVQSIPDNNIVLYKKSVVNTCYTKSPINVSYPKASVNIHLQSGVSALTRYTAESDEFVRRFITASSPPNIQRLPKAIHAQESALINGRLPGWLGSTAMSIPIGKENNTHHFGQGVCPFAIALICAVESTAKNNQNSTNAGKIK